MIPRIGPPSVLWRFNRWALEEVTVNGNAAQPSLVPAIGRRAGHERVPLTCGM